MIQHIQYICTGTFTYTTTRSWTLCCIEKLNSIIDFMIQEKTNMNDELNGCKDMECKCATAHDEKMHQLTQ